MRELVIKIDMNNAAFGDCKQTEALEATKILVDIVKDIYKRGVICDDVAMDSNGNCVGSIEVIEKM